MKAFTTGAAALACAATFTTPAYADKPQAGQRMACVDLVTLNLPDTRIDSATLMPASPLSAISGSTIAAPTCSSDVAAAQLPALCRVQGTVGPGQIKFEVWLPIEGWNGKYQGLGNHGFAGNMSTPIWRPSSSRATRFLAPTPATRAAPPTGCRTTSRSSITARAASTK